MPFACLIVVAAADHYHHGPGLPTIWPPPLHVEYGDRVLHNLPHAFLLAQAASANPVLKRALQRCNDGLGSSGGTSVPASGPISFDLELASYDEDLTGPTDESYFLNVSQRGVVLSARTVWGARHGLDSLRQLAVTSQSFRQAVVVDSPQFSYRGLMISPGQRFITNDLLVKTLDGMELARLNVLHFHLSVSLS